MKTEVDVNESMISWAISRAGFELKDFVAKFPKVKVIDWLEKRKKPTLKQLEKFSNTVHIPFGYLFLEKPPQENIPFPYFRTGNTHATDKVSLNVYDTIFLLQRRQDWLIEYLKETGFDELNLLEL